MVMGAASIPTASCNTKWATRRAEYSDRLRRRDLPRAGDSNRPQQPEDRRELLDERGRAELDDGHVVACPTQTGENATHAVGAAIFRMRLAQKMLILAQSRAPAAFRRTPLRARPQGS